MKTSHYTIWGVFWRILLICWPVYLIQSAWWEGSLWKLIAALVILLLVLWWLIFYAIKFHKQGKMAEAQRQETVEQIRAEEVRQEEWRRTHGSLITKVSGVTFENDDGSSRQEYLKEAYANKGNGTIEFERYTYQGAPAIHVLYEGLCIGNIPKKDVYDVLNILDRVTTSYLEVERFHPDDEDDCDGPNRKPETIYRADITIVYEK